MTTTRIEGYHRDQVSFGLPTVRQMEVLALRAQGLTLRQVGERLSITKETAEALTTRALAAMGCGNTLEAVGMAYRLGWFWWANGEFHHVPGRPAGVKTP